MWNKEDEIYEPINRQACNVQLAQWLSINWDVIIPRVRNFILIRYSFTISFFSDSDMVLRIQLIRFKIPYTHNTNFWPLIIINCICQTKSLSNIYIGLSKINHPHFSILNQFEFVVVTEGELKCTLYNIQWEFGYRIRGYALLVTSLRECRYS